MGTLHRDTVDFSGQHVGGRIEAPQIGGAAGGHAAVRALSAAQAEFQQGVVGRDQPHPGGFGGDEGLEINKV